MRLLKTIPTLSVEAIAHQSGEFYETLTEIIRSGNNASYKGQIGKGINKEIAACIKRYTNLTIEVDILDQHEEPGSAWIVVPVTDVNHSILSDGIRAFYDYHYDGKSLINEHSKKPGLLTRVDIDKGRVYGDYANVVANMAISDEFFDGSQFEPEECAAVILHEVGHYFSYVEFLTCSIFTNFVLQQLADSLSRTTNPKERESYIIAAKQVMGNSDRVSAEELSHAKDVSAVQIVLVKDYIDTKRTEFGYDVFNESTWEAMADQYASRQGAGRTLLTAIDKITRRYTSDLSYRSKPLFYFIEVLKVVFLFTGYFTIVSAVMILFDSANETYARTPVRYERIRNELVERLKDRKLGKLEQKKVTEDIVVVDNILKTLSDQRQWLSHIAALIFSSKREYYKAEAVARELEKLGANDFYLQAVKLKMLAGQLKP